MEHGTFCVEARTLVLDDLPLDAAKVVSGSPVTRIKVLQEQADGRQCGIWEHSVGVSSDVERAEMFVILSGRATVRVADGPTLELLPGTVGALQTGDETVWHVHETLRKFYQTV